MTRPPIPLLLLSGAAALALAGCAVETPAGQCGACTREFRVFTVLVLDDASQPVTDADLTVTNRRTGRRLQSGWLGLLAPGYYTVADDAMLSEFSAAGDSVRVVGTSPAGSFSADFLFQPDACACHLQRVAGPDTIVVGEPPPP
jgi:hypothetical protein